MITADNIKPLVASEEGGIQELMKEDNLSEPVFRKDGFFTVILQRPEISSEETTQETTQKTADRVIEMLILNPKAGRTEIAEALGNITEDGVKYQLSKLE